MNINATFSPLFPVGSASTTTIAAASQHDSHSIPTPPAQEDSVTLSAEAVALAENTPSTDGFTDPNSVSQDNLPLEPPPDFP